MAKILYFVEDVLTPDDATAMQAAGASLRNLTHYHEGDPLEQCDGVMGKAPQAYVDAFGVYGAKSKTPEKVK